MSQVLKLAVALGAVSIVAACSSPEPEEVVIVEPAPITDQAPSGKFK